MKKLSVVLATRNEEGNIADCIKSVKNIVDEIIVVDEESTDKTREIASSLGAKVYKVRHEEIFHKTKQKALNKAGGEWILSLDADERVTQALAKEIMQIVGDPQKYGVREIDETKLKLFQRHQRLLEKRDGKIGTSEGEVVAYFIPRINYFLGKLLIHGGVYPDGVIRLTKRGKAGYPAKSVHEQLKVDGRVSWLFNSLEHHDSPTLFRYLTRLNRYTDLKANELSDAGVGRNWIMLYYFTFLKPFFVFLKYYVRHKAFLDGMQGFLWSFFSASHFTIAYFKYWGSSK